MNRRIAKKIAGPPPRGSLTGSGFVNFVRIMQMAGVNARYSIGQIEKARRIIYGNERPSKEWIDSQ